jgi:soluble cytochrome b562
LAITKEQKAALEAAGYTVKNNIVKTKDGGTIGGYNENGKIFSGSGKVRDILKSKPAEPKAAPKTPAKASPAKQKKAPAKDAMKGYREGDVTTTRLDKVSSGRGDGKMETLRRTVDRALDKADKKAAPTKQTRIKPGSNLPDKEKTSSSAGAFIPLAAAAAKPKRKQVAAKGKPSNPNYKGGKGQPQGFQGKYATEVAPRQAGGRAGVGISGPRTAKQLAGGRAMTKRGPEDFNRYLN